MKDADPSIQPFVDPTTYFFNDTTWLQTKVQYVSGGGANTHEAVYEYDGDGRVTKVTDWLASGGNSRLYGYDNAGRLTKITEPDLANLTYKKCGGQTTHFP